MKKFIIYLMIIFSLCCSSAWACSKNDGCVNKGSSYTDSDTSYSECVESSGQAVNDALNLELSRRSVNLTSSDYPYCVVVSKSRSTLYYTSDGCYTYYYSTEPVYFDSSKNKYIFPADTVSVELFTIASNDYSGNKDSCHGSKYAGAHYYSSTFVLLSGAFDNLVSSNYDILDTNGNVNISASEIGKVGTIEIMLPEHPENNILTVVGSNEISLHYFWTNGPYAGFEHPDIQVIGPSEYEWRDATIDVDENGLYWGNGYYDFTLPYNNSVDVTLQFYDCFGHLCSDTLNITCFETQEDADGHGGTGGTIPDYDGSSGGSSSGSSSGNSKIKNFFKEANETVLLIGDFFGNFFGLIGSVFSFLPETFTTILIAGLVFVILLRIFGR